jgi:Cu+-exporting ATPase
MNKKDEHMVKPDDIIARIQKSGFSVNTQTVEFAVGGMTCANCAMNVERTLNKKVPGVMSASVNFASERATVSYLPNLISIEEMAAALEKVGFKAILSHDDDSDRDAEQLARQKEIQTHRRRFWVGGYYPFRFSS